MKTLLVLAACCSFALVRPAYADDRALSASGGVEGVDFTYEGGILEIVSETPLTISMADPSAAPTNDSIVVDPGEGKTAHVAIDGVRIERTTRGAPMLVESGALDLVIEGENSLRTGQFSAGLQNGENPLTISGAGSLEAHSRGEGAGIGGGLNGNGSNITIVGGTITATCEALGAGIGGGLNGNGSNITIAGGTVMAASEEAGAGIGGGFCGNGSNITITGGTVIAQGGRFGAGIGAGHYVFDESQPNFVIGTDIAITGGKVSATGGEEGSGIGGGGGGVSSGSRIAIEGGEVAAQGGNLAAGIGGGVGGDGLGIAITGGVVTAAGGAEGAGIGGGAVTGNGEDIAIAGGTVTAIGGAYAAGIGGGSGLGNNYEATANGFGSSIAIAGGFITAVSGQIPDDDYAQGTFIRTRAQAIGSGYGSLTDGEVFLAGGFFADEARDWPGNTVYGLTPKTGHAAAENRDAATRDAYPVRVLPLAALELTPGVQRAYDGSAAAASEVVATAGYGSYAALDDVELKHREADQEEWKDGLPKDAGTYRVRASLPEGSDAAGALYAAASAETDLAIAPAAFSYRIDDRQAAIGSPLADIAAPETAAGVSGERVKGALAWYESAESAKPLAGGWTFAGEAGSPITLHWRFVPDASETNYVPEPLCGQTTFLLATSEGTSGIAPAGHRKDALAATGDLAGAPSLVALACAASATFLLRTASRRR